MRTHIDIPVGLDDDGLEGFCQCAHSFFNHDILTLDRNGIERVACRLCSCKGFTERDPHRLGLMVVS